jgi:hypothetical protein
MDPSSLTIASDGYRGRVLLGWLTRDVAVAYLQNQCIFTPPLNTIQAEALWAAKREIVEALGTRAVPTAAPLPMTPAECEASEKFLEWMRRLSSDVRAIVKIDPSGLVCRQSDISLKRADQLAEHIQAATWAARNCLLPPNGRVTIDFTQFDPIGVSVIEGRAVLWSGYHRCYARIAAPGSSMADRSILAAVTTKGNQAVADNLALRAILLSNCPPLLEDFLDERLFLEVELRPNRYQSAIPA